MNNITNFLNEPYTAFSDHNNVSPSETTPIQRVTFLAAAGLTATFLGLFYLYDVAGKQKALNDACAASDRNKVDYLLSEGARANNPFFLKYFEKNPLIIASENASPQIVQTLIHSGANVNAQDDVGFTALMKASNRAVAELLIDNGADIHAKTIFGKTALHTAAANGKKDVVEALIAANADVNIKESFGGHTALHEALVSGNNEIAEALIEAGADTDTLTSHGSSSIELAIWFGNLEIVKLLMQKGAVVNMDKILLSAATSKDIGITKFFVDQGANINAQDNTGMTPLHFSSFQRHLVNNAKYLIEKGADVNIKSKRGYTPLDLAYMACNDELINILTSMNVQYSPSRIIPYRTYKVFERAKAMFHFRRA